MAYLHARADGDWTAAATWGVCNATALLDSQAANTALTTAFTTSATFTPGAITIDGIAVKVASRNSSPNGTLTVRLAQGGVAVAGTTVTINVADIPNNIGTPGNSYSGCSIGWLFLKFSGTVNLAAATAYTLQATTSVANQVNLFRNATANNWSRLIRTTTTGTPAAGDSMFLGGEWTSAGTKTDRTVTYDETASTDYGGADLVLASIGVSAGGTLALETTAATAYVLRLSGVLQVWAGATWRMGTSGTPFPDGSTFRVEFDCAADNNFGWCWYGTIESHVDAPFAVVRSRLTADAAATDTSLTVADATGWRAGDAIAIAPTQRSPTQGEARVLNTAAGASTLNLTVALTNAHAGNAAWEVQADVINLTRPITITNVTAAACTYGFIRGATVSLEWVGFRNHGNTSRVAFDVGESAVCGFSQCAFWDLEDDAFAPVTAGNVQFTFTECVAWNWASTTAGNFIQNSSTTNARWTFTDCTLIGSNTGSNTGQIGSGGAITMTGTRVAGGGSGLRITAVEPGIFEDCEFYSHGTGTDVALVIFSGNLGTRVRRSKFWRNGNEGCGLVNSYDVLLEECSFYGNTGSGLTVDDTYVEAHDCLFASETGFVQGAGVTLTAGENDATNLRLHGCDFSTVTGNRIAHTTDVAFTVTATRIHILASGCLLGGAAQFSVTVMAPGSTLAIQRRNDVTAVNSFRRYGYGQSDLETSIVGAASPSLKLTPESATRRYESQRMAVPVPSGQVATFTAQVRKNGSYTGSAPRLVLKANGAAGINKDVVLDTHTAAADVFEALTGASAAVQEDAVLEVVVDCDGTAGSVFVDDFTVAVA